jgi:hypothetical protein
MRIRSFRAALLALPIRFPFLILDICLLFNSYEELSISEEEEPPRELVSLYRYENDNFFGLLGRAGKTYLTA